MAKTPTGPPDRNLLQRVAGTPNDISAHLIARTELLALLAQDPAVVALFEGFTDVHQAAQHVAELFDPVAAAADVSMSPDYVAAAAVFRQRKFELASGPRLPAATEHLVREIWRLPWPWLTFELMLLHERWLNAIAFGHESSGSFSVVARPIRPLTAAPPPAPHESEADYGRRLIAFGRAMLGRSKGPRKGAAKGRKGAQVNAERIRRDVRWFYQAKIKHPPDTVVKLAHEYHDAVHRGLAMAAEDHRATVKSGIARARRLLSNVPTYVYRSATKP